MIRTLSLAICLLAAALAAGCRTASKDVTDLGGKLVDGKTARWISNSPEALGYYGAYTHQADDLVLIEGTNVEFKITGATRIAFRGFKAPPATPQMEPSTAAHALDVVGRVLGYAAAAYAIGEVSDNETTVINEQAAPAAEEAALRPRIGPVR